MDKKLVTETFYIEVGEYQNKEKGSKFPIYTGYVGPQLKKITVKFRRDAKNIPTKTGYITVDKNEMSLDTSKRYHVLWIHNVVDFKENNYDEKSNKRIDDLFSNEDLPF